MGSHYADRIREGLYSAFTEDHTPKEVAGSFALGTFITMLPTLGTGFLVFFLVVAVSERVSKLALFASVLVFNPLVKSGVYVVSFALGILLLGPVEGVSLTDVSLDAGVDVVVRLLVGNAILAVVVSVVSYVVVLRLVARFRETPLADAIHEVLEDVVEDGYED